MTAVKTNSSTGAAPFMSFTTRPDVIRSLKDSQSQVWETFFTAYSSLIRLHGKDCGLKNEHLDDLIQDVMIAVSKNSSNFQYDPAKGRFRDYLKRIIRAKAADILRRYYKKESFCVHIPESSPLLEEVPYESLSPDEALDDQFMDVWENVFLKNCLKCLKEEISPKHYQIFYMLEIQKIPPSKVASFSGLSLVSIYSIRSRIEQKLARITGKLAKEYPVESASLIHKHHSVHHGENLPQTDHPSGEMPVE